MGPSGEMTLKASPDLPHRGCQAISHTGGGTRADKIDSLLVAGSPSLLRSLRFDSLIGGASLP